ncbi:MAG TPA: hypothetical protein PLF42_15480, partial [Anaerolineales bacterium]|nr:hypothetical protein [Anaerolineales bacterium]
DVVIRHGQFLTQLFLYDLASGRLTSVTPEEGMENLLAAWSPDGEWIAVVRRDLAVPRGDQIWLMRADGGDARMITNDPDTLHGSLNWSPDGRYLLYDLYDLSVFPSVSNVRVMDFETGEVRDLGVNGFNPKWVW